MGCGGRRTKALTATLTPLPPQRAAEVAPLPLDWESVLWRVLVGPDRVTRTRGERLVTTIAETRRSLRKHLPVLQQAFDAYRAAPCLATGLGGGAGATGVAGAGGREKEREQVRGGVR